MPLSDIQTGSQPSCQLLMIEDNPGDVRLFQEGVHECPACSVRLTVAMRLAEAAERLLQETFDAIVLDLELPDSAGLETLSAVRSRATDTPIIVHTGHRDESLAVRALLAGAQDFLVKGDDDPARMLRSIRFAIARKTRVRDGSRETEERTRSLEAANDMLRTAVNVDDLTGLKNRRAIEAAMQQEVQRAERYGEPVSVILLDVDHFKKYNDTYGHPAGDVALRTVAALIRTACRNSDTVGRYGGEEFILILPNTDSEAAMAMAERLRSRIASSAWPICPLTASLGVSSLQNVPESAVSLIDQADAALYESKRLGRNRVTIFDDL